jgi:hypothetical protein
MAATMEPFLKSENIPHRIKPTNVQVLIVTTTTFWLFVIAEIIGAIVSTCLQLILIIHNNFHCSFQASHSLSLLGDGAAMSVDVVTVSLFYYVF